MSDTTQPDLRGDPDLAPWSAHSHPAPDRDSALTEQEWISRHLDSPAANFDPATPEPQRPGPISPRRTLTPGALILALALFIAGIGATYALWRFGASSSPHGSSGAGSPSSVPGAAGALNLTTIAGKVDPGVVDVDATLGYQGALAAGTGMVLTPSGLVLTNNHVIDGATAISVTDAGTATKFPATVVGYDLTHDVAVLQLRGAAGLRTVPMGSSSGVRVGDGVVAIGNAGGVGGTPSAAGGTITAIGRSISATDEASGLSEQLTGLLETSAPIEGGDSGGPLVSASGKAIGMDTAASNAYHLGTAANEGYAIPIGTALAIAEDIIDGRSSATVHLGPTAFLGVQVAASPVPEVPGAVVVGISPGTPAWHAGLRVGDLIFSVNGQTVSAPADLVGLLQERRPGDAVELMWQIADGQSHRASVVLVSGPPA